MGYSVDLTLRYQEREDISTSCELTIPASPCKMCGRPCPRTSSRAPLLEELLNVTFSRVSPGSRASPGTDVRYAPKQSRANLPVPKPRHHGYKVTQLITPKAMPPNEHIPRGSSFTSPAEHVFRHRYHYVFSFGCIRKLLKAANRYATNPSYAQDYRSKIKENSAEEMLDATSQTP